MIINVVCILSKLHIPTLIQDIPKLRTTQWIDKNLYCVLRILSLSDLSVLERTYPFPRIFKASTLPEALTGDALCNARCRSSIQGKVCEGNSEAADIMFIFGCTDWSCFGMSTKCPGSVSSPDSAAGGHKNQAHKRILCVIKGVYRGEGVSAVDRINEDVELTTILEEILRLKKQVRPPGESADVVILVSQPTRRSFFLRQLSLEWETWLP